MHSYLTRDRRSN